MMTAVDIEAKKCKEELSSIIDIEVPKVLRNVIIELCEQDFLTIWPEYYRSATSDGKFVNRKGEREALLRLPCMSGLTARPEDNDDDFLRALSKKLSTISDIDRERVQRELVETADTAGCISALLYFQTTDGSLFHRLEKKYPKADRSQLVDIRKLRNAGAHTGGTVNEDYNVKTAIQHLRKIKQTIAWFQNSKTPRVRQAADTFQKAVDHAVEVLCIPPINVSEFARENEISQENVCDIICTNLGRADSLDENKSVVLFLPQELLIRQIVLSEAKARGGKIDFSEAEQGVFASRLDLNEMKRYQSGKMSAIQLDELVNQFTIIADYSALLSRNIRLIISNQLGPSLKRFRRRLLIEFGTLSELYKAEKKAGSAEEKKNAHDARMQLYHMQKMGLVAYVGSTDHPADATESLLDFLKRKADAPICVISADRDAAERLLNKELPRCFCITNWKAEGFMVRSAFKERLHELCSPKDTSSDTAKATEVPVVTKTDAPKGTTTQSPKSPTSEQKHRARSVTPQQQIPATRVSYGTTPLYPGLVVPAAGGIVQDENKKEVRLGKMIGEPGGEGAVYKTDRPGLVAKIYHANRITETQFHKLRDMHNLKIDHSLVCWPKTLLFTKSGQFVGFLMPEAAGGALEMGLSIYRLSGSTIQSQVLPGWDRLSIARACYSVCGTFAYLHDKGVLMGDVNPRNLLVTPDDPEKVWFVDCDSYQFGGYNCSVGMPEYSSPEFLRRLDHSKGGYAECPRMPEDEDFALASLLFHMLMLGQTPFASKNNARIEEAIREYSFAYKTKETSGRDVPDGPYALIWNNMPPELGRNGFADVFTNKRKISAKEWLRIFNRYIARLSDGQATRELLPKKYYDATGTFFEDFVCAGCGQVRNKPKETVERLKEYQQPILCNDCMMNLLPLREVPYQIKCDRCGQTITLTKYDRALQELGKRYICTKCRDRKQAPRNR